MLALALALPTLPRRRVLGSATLSFASLFAAAIAILALSTAGCRSEKTESPAGRAAEPASRTPSPQFDRQHPVVRIETDLGVIMVRLDAVHAPGTVRNFLNYANDGFYNDTAFHYVAPGSMILGGGYTVDHRPKPPSYLPIRNEAHSGLKNRRGTVAMARDAAVIDSATSQFFINLADAPQRDHVDDSPDGYGYCVFGEVIEGMEVADRIAKSPTQNLGGDLIQAPHPPVVIHAIRLQ